MTFEGGGGNECSNYYLPCVYNCSLLPVLCVIWNSLGDIRSRDIWDKATKLKEIK